MVGMDACRYDITKVPISWGEAVEFRTFLQESDFPLYGDYQLPQII